MDLERDLNPEQRQAVLHGEGPLLVLAGAGSGKTRVITYRIAVLIGQRGVAPRQVLAVTFTNKAAGEMRARIASLVGSAPGLWALTFHAFGARLLRRHADLLGWGRDFTIYDADDSKRLGRLVLRKLDLDPDLYRVERMLAAVERAKRALKDPEHSGFRQAERTFYAHYQRGLRQANAFDFSDLLFWPNRLFERHDEVRQRYRGRFAQVLVDEFQDTDPAQFALLRHLCPPEANLCVVGDDDQSIYRWRGAEVGNILGFERHYPRVWVIKLERNYRSTGNILEAASAVIARNAERRKKRLWTEAEPGAPVRVIASGDEREEARQVACGIRQAQLAGRSLSQVAVFYRVNAQSRAVEEGLRHHGIAYRVVGGVRFFDRAEIRDLLAYLRLLVNPRSDVDLLRILNVPPRGLGGRTRERLVELAGQNGCSLLEVIQPQRLVGLREKERNSALAFGQLMSELMAESAGLAAPNVVRLVIERSGLRQSLQRQASEEARGRLENISELATAAEEIVGRLDGAGGDETCDSSLEAFLEHVALVTSVDLAEAGAEAVTLMTLHAAKGLEFEQVFITGVEDGLLPHRRALNEGDFGREHAWPQASDHGGIEEERRLFYVGMTRARQQLSLSFVRSRSIAGRRELNQPSQFLDDLPDAACGFGVEGGGIGRTARMVDLTDIDLDEADEIDPDAMGEADDLGDVGGGHHRTTVPDEPNPVGDGEVVDYGDEFNQDGSSSGLQTWRGRRVVHKHFGRGWVRDVSFSPLGSKLKVEFESVGLKTVVADYVKPA